MNWLNNWRTARANSLRITELEALCAKLQGRLDAIDKELVARETQHTKDIEQLQAGNYQRKSSPFHLMRAMAEAGDKYRPR